MYIKLFFVETVTLSIITNHYDSSIIDAVIIDVLLLCTPRWKHHCILVSVNTILIWTSNVNCNVSISTGISTCIICLFSFMFCKIFLCPIRHVLSLLIMLYNIIRKWWATFLKSQEKYIPHCFSYWTNGNELFIYKTQVFC